MPYTQRWTRQTICDKKEGGRGLASIENCMDASIRGLEDNIKMSEERIITAIRNSTDSIMINRTTTTTTRKQKWETKQLYGYFKRQTDDISLEKTWTWLRRGNLLLWTMVILNKGQTTIWEEIEIYSQEKVYTIKWLLVDKIIGLVNTE